MKKALSGLVTFSLLSLMTMGLAHAGESDKIQSAADISCAIAVNALASQYDTNQADDHRDYEALAKMNYSSARTIYRAMNQAIASVSPSTRDLIKTYLFAVRSGRSEMAAGMTEQLKAALKKDVAVDKYVPLDSIPFCSNKTDGDGNFQTHGGWWEKNATQCQYRYMGVGFKTRPIDHGASAAIKVQLILAPDSEGVAVNNIEGISFAINNTDPSIIKKYGGKWQDEINIYGGEAFKVSISLDALADGKPFDPDQTHSLIYDDNSVSKARYVMTSKELPPVCSQSAAAAPYAQAMKNEAKQKGELAVEEGYQPDGSGKLLVRAAQ